MKIRVVDTPTFKRGSYRESVVHLVHAFDGQPVEVFQQALDLWAANNGNKANGQRWILWLLGKDKSDLRPQIIELVGSR